MKLKEYREAVIAWLKEQDNSFKEIKLHGGVFDEDAVKRFIVKSPSLRIACLGIKDLKKMPSGHWSGHAMMVGYIVASSKGNVDLEALDYAEEFATLISFADFNIDFAGPADVQDISAIYSDSVDKKGVAIAAVSWTQDLILGRDHWVEDIIAPHEFTELDPLTELAIPNQVDWED